MGVHDAPQWLIPAWVRTCIGAGATAPHREIEQVGENLLARWSEPSRHFHNARHLADVLAHVDELAEEAHEPELVRLAAWYHGAVFDAAERASYAHRGGEDERASAALARLELGALGLPERAVERVAKLVPALDRHTPTGSDDDCAVLCDADLAMLAAEPQRYRAYLADVRAEYSHLPVEEFVRARIAILRRLREHPRLFASPMGRFWEEPARQNLDAELQRLERELGVEVLPGGLLPEPPHRAGEQPGVFPQPAQDGDPGPDELLDGQVRVLGADVSQVRPVPLWLGGEHREVGVAEDGAVVVAARGGVPVECGDQLGHPFDSPLRQAEGAQLEPGERSTRALVLPPAMGVGGPLGGIEDGTVIPGRESDQLGFVGLLGELVDVREDVGQVAGVVEVPAGLRPSRQQVLTDLLDLAVRGRRARADAGSDPGRDQPLGCIVDAHFGSVPLGGQRPTILAPATPADITTPHRARRRTTRTACSGGATA